MCDGAPARTRTLDARIRNEFCSNIKGLEGNRRERKVSVIVKNYRLLSRFGNEREKREKMSVFSDLLSKC